MGTGGKLDVVKRRQSAEVAVPLLLGAGEGIRARDIQIGSTIGPRPAYLIALTGLRHRFLTDDLGTLDLRESAQVSTMSPNTCPPCVRSGHPGRGGKSGRQPADGRHEARVSGGQVAVRIPVRRQRLAAQAIEDAAESRPSPNGGFGFGLGGHCAGSGQHCRFIARTHRSRPSQAAVDVPCPATDASGRLTRLEAFGCTPISINRTASTPVCLVRIPYSPRTCVQKTGGSRRSRQLDSGVPSAVTGHP